MNNIITDLLDLTDEDSTVTDFHIDGHTKYITIEKNLKTMICPCCGYRMYSHGQFKRHPNNPVLQDGYDLDVTLIGRRWRCTNEGCDYTCRDQFSFIEKNKKNTKLVPLMIIRDMKDINLTCRQVAARYHVSDTTVHEIFSQYISMPRLPLTRIISIDEVYLNISSKQKYALVIMDFETGTILDILQSRRKETVESYFLSIPKEERDKVEIIVSDMYSPYLKFPYKYFANSISIVDSFHVLQCLLSYINRYINEVKKKYLKRDRKKLEENNYRNNKSYDTQKDSREVYILKHAKWVLLRNRDNFKYIEKHYNSFLGQYLDTYDWEKLFLELDPNFKRIRDLKDLYEEFNGSFINDYHGATMKLNELINIYKNSDIKLFREFSRVLINNFQYIVNSFKYIKPSQVRQHHDELRRLSNGPMESFNNVPSSFRSRSHGLANFEFVRNRILWSKRDDAGILGVPRTRKEIHVDTMKKRGSYKKH